MPKMIFRGTKILDWNGVHDETGQHILLNMASDFSDPVREVMGWDISEELASLFPDLRQQNPKAFDRAVMLMPKGLKRMALDGDLSINALDLEPNGSDLAGHAVSLACTSISKFVLHRVKQKNGSYDYELRFVAVVKQVGGAKAVEGYIEAVGDKPAKMKVGYEKQEQLPMEDVEEEEDDAQERLISKEQAADTEEEDEPAAASEPALGPAVLVGGGTHQRRLDRQSRARAAEARKHGTLPTIDAETEEIVN